MATPVLASEHTSSPVSCGNCGRPYGSDDGLRVMQFTGTSVLRLRSLVARQFETIKCPACEADLRFEPAVFVVGIDPPIGYICGGNALSRDQVLHVIGGMEERAAAEGRQIEIRSFETQGDLRIAVVERLRSLAKAMTPLNAANAQGKLLEFVTTHWRTITPEVLVASDVVTLLEHVLLASAEAHRKGVEYFGKHAEALGQIQATSWLGLCFARSSRVRPPELSLERDLTTFVDRDAILNNALASFEGHARTYLAQEEDRRDPPVLYSMLALLARARAARGETNALAAEWTQAWMELELMLRSGEDVAAGMKTLALSGEAVAGTLLKKTLFDIGGRTLAPYLDGHHRKESGRVTAALVEIGEKARYPALASDVYEHGIRISIPDITTAEQAIAQLDALQLDALMGGVAGDETAMRLELAIDIVSAGLIDGHDVDGIAAIFQHALTYASNDWNRALLEGWYGATLLRLHQEQRFLDQVGADERTWEAGLSDSAKGRLWTERANALRATGRYAETLAWRKRVVPLYADEPKSRNHRSALRGLAIAERETGAPDRALALILPLLEDKQALDRVGMLDTAAAIWIALGELMKARSAIEEAVRLAVGPDAHQRQRFQTMLASLRRDTTPEDAERELLANPRDGWRDPATLLQELAGWHNLQIDEHDLSAAGEQRYVEALAAMSAALDGGAMPPNLREDAYITLAQIAERQELGDKAHAMWGAAADAADALGLVPRPEVVIRLAGRIYAGGKPAHARQILRWLPAALARQVRQVERIDVALEALTSLGHRLDVLTSDLLNQQQFHDARAVAEFRRDPLRRATSRGDLEADGKNFLEGKLFPPVVKGTGAVVLEFLPLEDGLAPVLTWQPAGEARPLTRQLAAPEVDVFELRDRIVNRLQGWVRGRPGDPFAVKDWAAFREWLRAVVGEAMPEAGHLVVIESQGLEGLPFHVAVAPTWTCSYTSSWISLAESMSLESNAVRTLSFAMVPAFGDDAKVAGAMASVGESLRGLAGRAELTFDETVGAACDQRALSALLTTSDVAFVACHGFLHPERKEVAWVLAHNGGLPGRTGVLVDSAERRQNHMSWRELEKLERTPQVVVSAACSSGRALVAGIGERIGLYQSLAGRGTRTLLAPSWDVEADLVLPTAAEAVRLHLEERMTLANAVRTACVAASRNLPDWCAWALTIEGVWL